MSTGLVVLLLVWLLLVFLGVGVTVRLVWRVWKRRREVGLAPRLFTLVAAALVAYALVSALFGLLRGFLAVGGEDVDPSQKARILAEGISEAINCIAFAVVVAVPALIVLFLLRRHLKARSP